jgi:hypothetical protein
MRDPASCSKNVSATHAHVRTLQGHRLGNQIRNSIEADRATTLLIRLGHCFNIS